MAGRTPLETVEQLIDAFHRGDVKAAQSMYEQDGVLVDDSGKVSSGPEALRKLLEGIIALKPTLTTETHKIIQVGDLALYCSRWRLSGTAPDGSNVLQSGKSCDVLRRTIDGVWLIAIDNPQGTAILG